MNEYTQLAVYLLTGSVGAIWHYAKKRYIEKTLTVSFTAYVTSDFSATFNTIVAIATAEFSLSALNVDHILHLQDVIGALTAGYMADSHLNKCNSN